MDEEYWEECMALKREFEAEMREISEAIKEHEKRKKIKLKY